jgi:hypothetical protein
VRGGSAPVRSIDSEHSVFSNSSYQTEGFGLYMPRAEGDSCGSLGSYALVDGTIYGTCDSRLYDRSNGLTFHYMDFPRRFTSTVHVRCGIGTKVSR